MAGSCLITRNFLLAVSVAMQISSKELNNSRKPLVEEDVQIRD